jgi:coproporphyrinogen III oxidase
LTPNLIMSTQAVRDYLLGLQDRITTAIAAMDGGTFLSDAWEKAPGEPLQGNGITRILEGGAVFERAGCGFSHVRGPQLPPALPRPPTCSCALTTTGWPYSL